MEDKKFPFPRGGSGNPGHSSGGNPHAQNALPKMPSSGTGSNGADGLRKVPTNAETRSSGPTGGRTPSPGTSTGLPRRSSN